MHLNWILVTCLLVLLSVGLTTRTVDASKKSKEESEEEETSSTDTDSDTDSDDDDDDAKKGKSIKLPLFSANNKKQSVIIVTNIIF
jgi:hypothetical protein